MNIKLDSYVNPEIKEFLLTQEGITYVDINYDNNYVDLNIKYNKKTNPYIIMKYIELFQNTKYSCILAFDKGNIKKYKTLKYIIDDMCCEYCYMGFIMDLFENNNIKSVNSNFDYNMPAFNIEFLIEYSEEYNEQELIEFIKEKYN